MKTIKNTNNFKRYPLTILLKEYKKPIQCQNWNSEPHKIIKMYKKEFPSGKLISHVELSPDSYYAAEKLLDAGKQLHERITAFTNTLPKGYSHQFYGKWDCLVVKEVSNLRNDSDA